MLGNGTEIWNFEDLAPVIEPTSVAGAAVQEYRGWTGRHHATWRNALLAGLVGGLAIAYAGHETDSHMVTVAGFVVAGAAIKLRRVRILVDGRHDERSKEVDLREVPRWPRTETQHLHAR